MPQMPLGAYRIRAQLAPALVVLLPIVVSAVTWFSDAIDFGQVLVGVVIAMGGMFFLAQVGRDAGRRKEAWLHSTWGGKPTTALLRHRDDVLDASTRARYHVFLSRRVPGVTLLSPEDEAADPKAADSMYDSAVQWLIAQAPDRRRFPLVFQENVNYGFRRNLWGLRPAGLVIATACLFANAGAVFALHDADSKLHVGGLFALIITSLLVSLWIKIVKPEWVRVPAYAYARALFQMCDVLSTDTDRATERDAASA